MTVPCNCDLGLPDWRLRFGFKENEPLFTFEEFGPGRQPEMKARLAAAAALKAARTWARGELRNLILSGPTGVGKTHLAKAALWALADGTTRGYYITVGTFDYWSKAFEDKPWVRERRRTLLFGVPMLVLDDVGSANRQDSAWMRERFEELFDERYRGQLSSLVTTNLIEDEFKAAVGVRVVDRLRENGQWLYMPGESMRRWR